MPATNDIITLHPPPTFVLIHPALPLYRCASLPEPIKAYRPFLKTLGLQTLLWLAFEAPDKFTTNFCQEQNIALHHIRHAEAGGDPYSVRTFEKVLKILARENGEGSGATLIVDDEKPVFVGMLRKVMKWGYTQIVLEYRSLCEERGGDGRYRVEEWLEGVDVSRVVVPAWLQSMGPPPAAPLENGRSGGVFDEQVNGR